MSWAGDTIARSLALVTIATGAAFIHWSCEPLTLSLKAPNPSTTPSPDLRPVPPEFRDSVKRQFEKLQSEALEEAAPEQSGSGDAGVTDTPPPAQSGFDPTALGNEIGTAEAFALWQTGTVAFIDARPAKDYEAGHVPFSYLVPADSIDKGRLGDMMEIAGVDPSWRVVVYCEGGTCDASHLVALTLQDMGFERIHIDVDGFPAWQAAGHEVETGPDQVLGDVP